MDELLLERIKNAFDNGQSIEEVKSSFMEQGYLEDDVIEAISRVKKKHNSGADSRNNSIFTSKEVLDRIGYGFANTQFINILFFITGAGLFLIGLINGLKSIISLLLTSFVESYSQTRKISKGFISAGGIIFGLSFLFIAMSVVAKSPLLFSISLLLGSIGVVTYGDLYTSFIRNNLKKEKMGKFLLQVSHYGSLITAFSILISGWLFDAFPIASSQMINIFGKELPLLGYLISFEITAIAFILSGYLLNFVKEKQKELEKKENFFSQYIENVKISAKEFLTNKYLLILLIASSITGLVQMIGYSYYGIFIYQLPADKLLSFGSFFSIGVMLCVAVIVSFAGPAFSRFLNKKVGLAPSMVFGSMLVAMMPLVSAYNPHFYSLLAANSFSVIGAAILGFGQGIMVAKLLPHSKRKDYFMISGLFSIIPFIIFVPLFAFLAGSIGLILLFKILALILLIVVAPLYFALVVMANNRRL
jgi:MFS family permease